MGSGGVGPFRVRRETAEERAQTGGGPDWLVVVGGAIIARYSRRTNWIDGKAYGPSAAAEKRAELWNEAAAEAPPPSEATTLLAEFHGHPNSLRPTGEIALRRTLHAEEHAELEAELAGPEYDRAKIARELADVAYVAFGTAWAFEIDLDAAIREVHKKAMEKVEAAFRREDGKIVKPPGFEPPDMTEAIRLPEICGTCESAHPDWVLFDGDLLAWDPDSDYGYCPDRFHRREVV